MHLRRRIPGSGLSEWWRHAAPQTIHTSSRKSAPPRWAPLATLCAWGRGGGGHNTYMVSEKRAAKIIATGDSVCVCDGEGGGRVSGGGWVGVCGCVGVEGGGRGWQWQHTFSNIPISQPK
jgi:hypothetical protein